MCNFVSHEVGTMAEQTTEPKFSPEELEVRLRELPPLNAVAQRLARVAADPKSSAADVTKALSGDDILIAKVMELVNSSFVGLQGKVSTLNRAVVLLGNKAVEFLALSFTCVGEFKEYDSGACIPKERFWNHTMAVATAAQALAEMAKYPVPEEAFLAGMLHDMGKLLLSHLAPESFKLVVEGPPEEVLRRESEIIGATHAEVCATLLSHWHLPKNICETVLHHHDLNPSHEFERLMAIVMAAELLAEVHGVESIDYVGPASRIYDLLGVINLPHTDYYRILFDSRKRLSEAQNFFDIPMSVASRVKPPAPPPDDPKGKTVAVVSSSSFSADWIGAIAKLCGYHPISVSIFNQAMWHKLRDADICLIDPNNAEPDAMAKLLERLAAFEKPTAVIADEVPDELQTLLEPCERLTDILTEADLHSLAAGGHRLRAPQGS